MIATSERGRGRAAAAGAPVRRASSSTTACPERTGLELLRELAATLAEGERPQVIMMTAHATVESAIEAMKLGAYDYLQKPFEVDELLVAVRRALEHQRLRRQHRYLLLRARRGVRPLRHHRPEPRDRRR